MAIETHIFSLAPGVYSRQALDGILGRYWWSIAVPDAVFAVMGFLIGDTWWWVALIFTFLVAPLFVFFAYFSATLNRLAVDAVKPHSISDTTEGFEYLEYEVQPADGAKTPAKKSPATIYSDDAGLDIKVMRKVGYTREEVADIRTEGSWIKIILKNNAGTILIPTKALIIRR